MAGGRSLPAETITANKSHLNRNVEPSCLNAFGRKILHDKVIFTGAITPQREEIFPESKGDFPESLPVR